jgi:acyl-coenzyme A synthetase/AMP-(fatty) acid ligase
MISYKDFIKNSKLDRKHCKTESMNSEDSLFILYTSGTTGKPKRNSTHTWRFYDGCCKTDGSFN